MIKRFVLAKRLLQLIDAIGAGNAGSRPTRQDACRGRGSKIPSLPDTRETLMNRIHLFAIVMLLVGNVTAVAQERPASDVDASPQKRTWNIVVTQIKQLVSQSFSKTHKYVNH